MQLSHRYRLFTQVVLVALATAGVAACSDANGTSPPEPIDDAGFPLPDAPPPPEEPSCEGETTFCDGFCADLDDSIEHCGACSNDCRNLPHSDPEATACTEGSCTLSCQSGYGDCDDDASNGCEVSLSEPEHCGDCTTACANPTPLCEAGDTPLCVDTCTAPTADLCGSTCTNLQTDPKYCGDCDTACPVPQNGSATCQGGACGASCFSGYHSCGNPPQCLINTSVSSCGTRCTPCAVPTNGYATCDGTNCGFACYQGYLKVGTKCEPLWQNVTLKAPTGLTGVYTKITALHGANKDNVFAGAVFLQTNKTERYFILSAIGGQVSYWLDSRVTSLFVLPRDEYNTLWTWAGFHSGILRLYYGSGNHLQWQMRATPNMYPHIRSIWAPSRYNSYWVGDQSEDEKGGLWHPNQSNDAHKWIFSTVATSSGGGGFTTIRDDRQGGLFVEHHSRVYASADRDGPWTKGTAACTLPNNKFCWATAPLEVNTDGSLLIAGFEKRDTQPFFKSYVWCSTNRGSTWTTLFQLDGLQLNAVAAAGQHLFAGGQGYLNGLYHSTDGGATWTNESPTVAQSDNYYYGIHMMWTDGNKSVYAAGTRYTHGTPSSDQAFIWRRRAW